MQSNNKSIDNAIGQVIKLQLIFFAMSILLLVLDFIFRDNINGYVWLRSGGLAILSLVYIRFGFKLKERKRTAYIRVMIISIAGAFGIYALAIGGGDVYPLWMRLEQGIQGLLLIMIIIILTRPKNRIDFAKEQK
ncbi:hypothetical protein QUF81_18570 [Peribacillus simplex]|uniref:hypothetical protein n=1 Tax=Peribacillus simplex TaxID=1478 RepID=UPI0025A1768E|nr:hypothetical protein [Peribacillus simplex]MDM5295133.1 hypothetical protein [Peribacillus simplex]